VLVKGSTIEVQDVANQSHSVCFESPEEAIFVCFKLTRALQQLSTADDDDIGPIVRLPGDGKGKEEEDERSMS
jgi:hypothetical protein